MLTALKNAVRQVIRLMGYNISRIDALESMGERERLHYLYRDFEEDHIDTILAVKDYTMTNPERLFSLIEAVKYISMHDIPGSIVECGVWRGGSMMAAARTLLQRKDDQRHLYLFDTFEGMPPPTEHDVCYTGHAAHELLASPAKEDQEFYWGYASVEEVKRAMYSVGYQKDKIHFVQGRVEETIPAHAPETIALLRLDTDWYESTRHELVHLFPRLSRGGVLILDDYGFWRGVRKATDEFIKQNHVSLLLCRIDNMSRVAVKL